MECEKFYWERDIGRIFGVIIYYHGFGLNKIRSINIYREIRDNENGYVAKILEDNGE